MITRVDHTYAHWDRLLVLLQDAFAYMSDLTGTPPNVASMTPADLAARAADGAAWVAHPDAPTACLFARPSRDYPDALFLTLFAVDAAHRGTGVAGELLGLAQDKAIADGCARLTLDTGSQLTALRARYRKWGWDETKDDGAVVTFMKTLPKLAQTGETQ